MNNFINQRNHNTYSGYRGRDNMDPTVARHHELQEHYNKVMLWLFSAFGIAAMSTVFIGPLVPPGVAGFLSIALLIVLLLTSFVRGISPMFANVMVILVPVVIGIILYPTLEYKIASGSGNSVWLALAGTAIVFGSMAIWGWVSKKDTTRWGSRLFVILLGVVAVSLLNTFIFHVAGLAFIISIAVIVLFSFYTFYDIQRMRDKSYGNAPASVYALNIFLDIINIFTSMLNLTR